MRTTFSVRALSCLLVIGFVFTQRVAAATFTWAGGGTTSWGDTLNWDVVPTSGNDSDLVFNTNINTGTLGVATLTQNITPTQIINSLNFGSLAGSFVTGGGTLLVGNGATIRQNSSSDQFLSNGFRGTAAGTNVLTLTGDGTGIVTMNGLFSESIAILAGMSINKTGTSTYVLTGTNTNISGHTITAGVLQANNGVGLPASSGLFLRGGVLQSDGTGSVAFTRNLGALTFNWGAGGGGFSAGGGGTMTIRLNNGTNSSTWASTSQFLQNATPLILSSNTATGLVDYQNGINLGSAAATQRMITVNDNPNLTTDLARISGILSSTTAGNSLLKNGPGRLELTALNTYTGLTQVGAGTVAVLSTGSLSGSVRVDAGATFDVTDFNAGGGYTFSGGRVLSGTGTVVGKVNINSTGAIAPGSSVGTIATQSQDWGAGGVYNFELSDATGLAGTGFDQLQMSGSLTISASTGNQFTIKVASTPGDAANFDINGTLSWIIATTTDGVSNFDSTAFVVDRSAFTNDTSASNGTGFFVTSDGNNIILNYDGVPEPATSTLFGLAALAYLTRRPRRR